MRDWDGLKPTPLLLPDLAVQETVKFGGGNIMVWVCMGWNKVGHLAEVEGRMDTNQYVSILEDHMLPSLDESEICEEVVIFQQNNDPKHTSKKAKKWMEDHNITHLDWPVQSPDISPIEHQWVHMKREYPIHYAAHMVGKSSNISYT